MNWQNLGYAAIQVAHNFGAVAVVGGPLFALWPMRLAAQAQRRLAALVLAGFIVQAVSGAGFGAVSYYWYGQFPDIHGVAIVALVIKIVCAVIGAVVALVYLVREPPTTGADSAGVAAVRFQPLLWGVLLTLGVTGLSAAAVLRWFS